MKLKWNILAGILLLAVLFSCTAFAEDPTPLPAPTFSVTGSTFSRGELMYGTLGEVDGAEYYKVDARDSNNQIIYLGQFADPGEIAISTAKLPAGSYTLRAYAMDEEAGVDDNGDPTDVPGLPAEVPVTVTAYAAQTPAVIRLGQSTVTQGRFTRLSVYAPGATFMRIISDEDQDLDFWAVGEYWDYNVRLTPGAHHIHAEVLFSDETVYSTETLTLTVNPMQIVGTLGQPSSNLTEQTIVTPGTDLTVSYTFGPEENTDGIDVVYGWSLFHAEDTSTWLYDDESLTSGSGTFVVDGSLLVAGHRYILQLYTYTDAEGYATQSVEYDLFAVPAASGNTVTLYAPGVDGNEITIDNHENIDLRIHAPNAAGVRFYRYSDEPWEWLGGLGEDDIYCDFDYWTDGTFALYAQACFNADPLDEQTEWVTSAPLIVHVTSNGTRLPAPQFTVPATVTIGNVLQIPDITLSSDAVWCWADVFAIDDNGEVDWDGIDHTDMVNGTMYLATKQMEPGRRYLISMACSAPGWLDSLCTYRVITAQGTDVSDLPYFEVFGAQSAQDRTIVTNGPVVAMAYVPGATELRVYVNGNQDENWCMEGGNSFNISHFEFRNSGEYILTLSARFTEGDWNGWSDWTDMISIRVEVSAPNGELDLAGLTSIPHEWTPGQNLALDFTPSQAEGIEFNLWREWDYNFDWYYGSEDNLSLTIPGSVLREGVYTYRAELYATGYESATIRGTIVVTENHDTGITLTAPASVQCGEELTIQASAPDATAISIWIPGENEGFQLGDSIEMSQTFRRTGEFVVYARACYDPLGDVDDWYDGVNWGPVSAVKVISVTSQGTAGLPNITGLAMGDAVAWNTDIDLTLSGGTHADWYDVRIYMSGDGETKFYARIDEDAQGTGGSVHISTYDMEPGNYFLEIHVGAEMGYADNDTRISFRINGYGQCEQVDALLLADSVVKGDFLSISFPSASNAIWYDVRIRDEGWNEFYYIRYYEAGPHLLPTVSLNPGDTYVVMVATGAPGYQWNESSFDDAPRFTVTEPQNSGLQFNVDKTHVMTCEDLIVSAYAPGADRIVVMANNRQRDMRDGEAYCEPHSFDEAGTYAISVAARYWENEGTQERWEYSDPIEIQVGSAETPDIDLSALALTIPSVIQPGQDLTISWQDIDLWHYDIHIFRTEDGGSVWHSWNGHGETSVTIPAVMPAYTPDNVERMYGTGEVLLEEGVLYDIQIHFTKRGANSAHFFREFLVLGETDSDITVSVGGSQDTISVPMQTDTHILINAPDAATAALVWDGYQWQWMELDEHGDGEMMWSWSDDRLVFAKYTTQTPDGRSWEDYAWSGLSNQVRVIPTSSGSVPAPDITMDSTFQTGSTVRFTVNNIAALNGYSWTVADPVEDWEWGWEDWRGNPTQAFRINGFQIGRTYVLKVHAHASQGLEGTDTEIPFTVTGNGQMPAPQANVPATVVRGDLLEVTLENIQAVSTYEGLNITAAPYDAVNDEWLGRWYDWNGVDRILIPTSNLEARTEPYTLYVEAYADGWVTTRVSYEFVVTGASGPRMSFGTNNAQTMEEISFSLYVPGADMLRVTINEEEGWTWENVWIMETWGGSFADGDWLRFQQSGTYVLKLYAQMGTDEWQDTGLSATIQVTGLPVNPPVFPVTIPEHQDLVVEIPAGITYVYAHARDETHWSDQIYWLEWDEGESSRYDYYDTATGEWTDPVNGQPMFGTDGTIRIPSAYLKRNHTYRFDINMGGPGYDEMQLHDIWVTVVGSVDSQISFNVYLEDDTRNPYVSEEYRIAAQSDDATAIRIFDGWNWAYETGNSIELTRVSGETGTRYLYAQAYYGEAPWEAPDFDWGDWNWDTCGLAWGGVSNIVPLTFESLGECGRVTPQISQTSVIRGDFLEVTFPQAQHAEWYDIHIRDEDWNERYYMRVNEPGTYRIPTVELSTGMPYRVIISTGAYGYMTNENEFETAPVFTVDEPQDNSIRFSADKTTVEPWERVNFSLYAPDADEIRMLENNNQYHMIVGNTYTDTRWYDAAGTYEIVAAVHYPDDDRWKYSDPIVIVVGDENTTSIDLTALALSMPDRLQPNEALTISWQDLGIEHYDLSITQMEDNRQVWHSWGDNGETSVTVPCVAPSYQTQNVEPVLGFGEAVFEEGQAYQVDIHFNKAGYNGTGISRQLIVLDQNAQGAITLTVNGSQNEVELPIQTDAQIAIDAPNGATAALFWNGYDWLMFDLDEQGNAAFTWNNGGECSLIFYARYTTEPIDGREYTGYAWSDPSNLVPVHVIATGTVPAADVTMPSSVWTGSTATFTVNNPTEIGGFNWTVYDPIDGWEWGWEDWRGNASQSFGTAGLKIGRTYVLRIQTFPLPGLSSSRTEIPFTVSGDGAMVPVQASVPQSVVRGDMLEITIQNVQELNAYQDLFIQAAPYDPTQNQWFGQWYAWDGEDTILVPTSNLEARSEPYTLYVEDWAEGRETTQAEYSFVVTEPTEPRMVFSKTSVQTMERISFSLYVPGASAICVTVNEQLGAETPEGWIMETWYGDYAEGDWFNLDQAGTYMLYLYAQYGTDEWQDTGKRVVIQAAGVPIDLEAMVPGYLTANTDFRIELPSGIQGVYANVWDEMTGAEIYWMNWEEGRSSDYNYYDTTTETWTAPENGDCLHSADGTILIPSSYLKANHVYCVNLEMYGLGYNRTRREEMRFIVVADQDSRVTLTVTLPDASRNLLVNEEFHVLVNAEGAAAVRFFDGMGWDYQAGATLERVGGMGTAGTFQMYAQAYYGEAPWSDENFNWDTWDWGTWDWNNCGFDWSATSNVVEVTIDSYGLTEPFDFTNHSDVTVNRGEMVCFTFTEPEHANVFWVDAFDADSNSMNPECNGHGSTVYLRTANLPEGTYTIRGRAGGVTGYEWRDSDGSVTLTVQSPKTPGTPTMRTPGMLSVIEEEAFMGTAAQVVEVGEGVSTIGERAFANSQLEQVILPWSVYTIGTGAFDSDVEVFTLYNSYAMEWALENGLTVYEIQ